MQRRRKLAVKALGLQSVDARAVQRRELAEMLPGGCHND
jgi:hypothetical protein